MKRNVSAQAMVGGLASNPANGINNIPLQSAGNSSGVAPDELLGILTQIQDASSAQMVNEIKPRLEALYARLQRAEMQDDVQKILRAIDWAQDPRKRTVDPSTGKEDPGPKELAEKLMNTVNAMQKQNEQAKNVTSSAVFNMREAQRRKKKARGNPFRVLMGKVGKLLDHGLEKRDIVRYLKKSGYWNDETIERAVDIVRDYNKKKRRDNKDEDPKADQKDKKAEASNAQPALHTAMQRVSAAPQTIYDVEPDFAKRGLTELMARASWLMSLMSWDKDTPQGDGKKAADKKGAAAELKAIKKALVDRGFDQDELSMMGIK